MLVEAVSLLLSGLNQHIHAADGSASGSTDVAIWGNVSQWDHPDNGTLLENQLILSLINLEEEATLKNGQTAFRHGSLVEYRHRPVHLNLFLIFAANYTNYDVSLQRLDQVVTYFQSHKQFDPSSFPGAVPAMHPETELSLTMELVSLSLEEINHLWGVLGGKALPFVAYRGRLVVLEEEDRAMAGGKTISAVLGCIWFLTVVACPPAARAGEAVAMVLEAAGAIDPNPKPYAMLESGTVLRLGRDARLKIAHLPRCNLIAIEELGSRRLQLIARARRWACALEITYALSWQKRTMHATAGLRRQAVQAQRM